MASVFVKVKCSDRLPKHFDKPYITDKGLIKSNYFYSQCVEWFMEEIELPSEEEVKEELMHPVNISENTSTLLRDMYEHGIARTYNFILNKLKRETN